MLNCTVAKLGRILPRFKRLLRRFLVHLVLARHLFLSDFFLNRLWCGETNHILDGARLVSLTPHLIDLFLDKFLLRIADEWID